MNHCRICRDRHPAVPGQGRTLCPGCWAESAAVALAAFLGRPAAVAAQHWFHVSPHQMEPGTVIRPGFHNPANDDFYRSGFVRDSGVLAPMGVRREEVVWLSPSIDDAAFWSLALSARHCYEVDPTEEPRPWNGTGTDGWVSPAAVIIREI